jgi:hypothetical protein
MVKVLLNLYFKVYKQRTCTSCDGNTICLSCADQKSKTLKLAPLLSQYLYDQKKLDLAGIGSFLLDASSRTSTDAQHLSEGISFKYDALVKEDANLISYISTETGKMKALAASDLGSYIDLAREFLNIGKPFQIEGIGTLVKSKNGDLEFTADHLLIDKVKETGIKELSATSTSDESITTYESLRPRSEKTPILKRILFGLLIIATTGLIIWAGYRVYKYNSPANSNNEQTTEETIPVSDTSKYIPSFSDTTASEKKSVEANTGNYRFVIEEANKRRAFYRYDMLKKGGLPIKMSTKDSVIFKLFFVMQATPADTARISDSLTVWYPAVNHKRAFAEQ